MTITQDTAAQAVGKTFANEVRGMSIVRGIWVRPSLEGTEIWVQVDERIDNETELELYRIGASLLDIFPETFNRVFVVNPLWFDGAGQLAGNVIPGDASPVPLED